MKNYFMISPVRNMPNDIDGLFDVVKRLENGEIDSIKYKVHWPIRDTKQEDHLGGSTICRYNYQKVVEADMIGVWYDPNSQGSIFDFGMAFALAKPIQVFNLPRRFSDLPENGEKNFGFVLYNSASYVEFNDD